MGSSSRRGITMLVVLAVIGASALVLAYAMQSIVAHHRQARLRHEHRQCRLLSEAGLDRAAALLAVDSDFLGDNWQVAATDTGLAHDAMVSIEVKPNKDGSQLVTTTTQYPSTGQPRVTHTEQQMIDTE